MIGFLIGVVFGVIFLATGDPFAFIVSATCIALAIATELTKQANVPKEKKCPPHNWLTKDGILFCQSCGGRPKS